MHIGILFLTILVAFKVNRWLFVSRVLKVLLEINIHMWWCSQLLCSPIFEIPDGVVINFSFIGEFHFDDIFLLCFIFSKKKKKKKKKKIRCITPFTKRYWYMYLVIYTLAFWCLLLFKFMLFEICTTSFDLQSLYRQKKY